MNLRSSVHRKRLRLRALGPLLAGAATLSAAGPRTRPVHWAQPVIGTSLGNCFKVSDDLYRSEQPSESDLPDLQALGIRTVLNLREYHSDSPELAKAGLNLVHYPVAAGSLSDSDMVKILTLLRDAPKPVLVHCWHGSDRTGFTVAGYRMVLQGWTAEAAIDEFREGGFGYHRNFYPKIPKTLSGLDLNALRQRLGVKADP